jgi:hypothetical protein
VSGTLNAHANPAIKLLRDYLASAGRQAKRLAWSEGRVQTLMPLDGRKVDKLKEEEIEKLDALLFRFNSLTAMVQDHLARALLRAEEEDIAERSRKDQRLLLEKLGALEPQLGFGTIAELRNRIAHHYPDESAKQAEILNEVFRRSRDLIQVYETIVDYVKKKNLVP